MFSRFSSIIIILALSSCANLNSIFRHKELQENISIASVDAKQRFVLTTTQENVEKKPDANGGFTETKTKYPYICTEPSPDVFSVYSAAIEANASKAEELTAALKATTGENGATIGIRSEVIQLMRDAMYRLCEANLSGAMQDGEYRTMLLKYQKSMVTLIAISQLTHSVTPSQVVLSSDGKLELKGKKSVAKENLDNSREQKKIDSNNLSDNSSQIAASITALGGDDQYDILCPNGVAIDAANNTKCENHKNLLESQSILTDKLAFSTREVLEREKVFNGIDAELKLSTDSKNTVINNASRPMTVEEIKAVTKSVEKMVDAVYFEENSIKDCIKTISKISEAQQVVSTRKGQEQTNYVNAQKIMLSLCDKIAESYFN